MEFQRDGFAVEVAVEVQDPGLHGDVVAADRGAHAHVGHCQIAFFADPDTAGVNAESGDQNTVGKLQIGGGDADGAAQLPSGHHGAGKDMGMAQQAVGFFHVARFQKGSDAGGGNALTLCRLLRHDDAGKLVFAAELPQLFRVTLALVAKAEILAADETGGSVIQQIFQEVPPRS